ncbi:MAG TPA: amidohydrolase family protein [Thermogutta sp.]|nr:amidohydrolase family protein [Thermogutta sp.]HOP77008.1 amidohydrolase family protein [Thermogutta sp.]HPU06230.1 amidohydrolase family protein [Thermogutta sp.]HQF13928.1 amidohydrolase family protein [Thermogutta sp.]
MTDPHSVTRRGFLGSLSAGGIMAGPTLLHFAQVTDSEPQVASSYRLIDTHVYLFQWPFRLIHSAETAELVRSLKNAGVTCAWAGSLESLLHRDIASVNARLHEECRKYGDGFLVPCGTINPMLPDWTEDFRQCVENYKMRVLRLFPGYHGYTLDIPEVGRLLALAHKCEIGIQITIEMEDVRAQNPLLPVKPVEVTPLGRWLEDFPALRLMLLNCHRAVPPQQLAKLVTIGWVYVDLGMLEGIAGLERLTSVIPIERICFGSFAPVFYFESALLKLAESHLPGGSLDAICYQNAETFSHRQPPYPRKGGFPMPYQRTCAVWLASSG